MARAEDKHSRGGLAGRGRRRGQSMVELALMMPLLALIMVGTLDMGRVFFYYTRLSDAVKEGALFGMRTPAAVAPSSSTCYTSEFQNVDPDNVLYHVRQAGSGLNLQDCSGTTKLITVTCYSGTTTTVKPCAVVSGTGQAASGDTMAVTATYDFVPITKQLMGVFGGPKWTIRKTVKMRIL